MTLPALPTWVRAVPGLRWPWLLAVNGVCALGVWFGAAAAEEDALPYLLLLAPLLPVVCVAASYGAKADPFAQVARSTPAGGLRLLLLRTGVVLAVCLPLLAVVGVAGVGGSVWAAAWLTPCLTLTLATLVLGSYIGCLLSSVVTAGGWLLAVSSVARLAMRKDGRVQDYEAVLLNVLKDMLGNSGQFVWGAAAGVLAAVLLLRRDAFNDLRSRGSR
jgi:hypothetical protein